MPPRPTPAPRSSLARGSRRVACALLAAVALAGCAKFSAGAKPGTATNDPQQALAPEVAMAAAEAAYAAQDWPRAESNYLAAARASTRDPEPWFKLGNVYFRRARYDLASRAYEEALRVAPDHAKAWHNLGVVRLHQADESFAHVLAGGDPRDEALDASAAALRAIIDEAIAPGGQATR